MNKERIIFLKAKYGLKLNLTTKPLQITYYKYQKRKRNSNRQQLMYLKGTTHIK